MNFKNILIPQWAVRCFRHGLFLALTITANSVFAVSEPISDVRVIIDVSGSMKKNDPKNLRAPALRMLVGLLPPKTKSGVWTFGKYVNMQVKHGKVTSVWKKQAMSESKKIHSRGLFTNIEGALKRASRGWETVNKKEQRHLILLTDGMVDISKNQQLNDESRKRILSSIVPKLKKSAVTIHTIALSKNADKKLMSAISAMTDGWHEAVDNAEDLQRVFLHIFEKSNKVDSVPLDNNKFSIDKSIEDMTVLVFRKPEISATKLITPGKETWSFKKHPSKVTWHQDTGYDLISTKNPQVGQWMINAAIDPDNRVMVVTNLKLVSGDFPNNIMYGDRLSLTAKLSQEGKTVTQERLLKLVKFNVSQHAMLEQPSLKNNSENINQVNMPMFDDGKSSDRLEKDGVYTVLFNSGQSSGDVTLTIQAKSAAFEREVKHIIKIHATPADLNINQLEDGSFSLEVAPRMELLIPNTVSIQVTLPDGSKKTLQQGDNDKWQTTIAKEHTGKRVAITLVGTRVNDKPFHVDFDKVLEASQKGGQSLSLEKQATKKMAIAKTEPETKEQVPVSVPPIPTSDDNSANDTTSHGDDGHKETEEGFNWLSTMMIIIYANIVLGLLGGAGYLLWRKRKAKLEKEHEELSL